MTLTLTWWQRLDMIKERVMARRPKQVVRAETKIEYHTISECAVARETEKAVLVTNDDFDDPGIWVPKSVISEDSDIQGEDDTGDLIVEEWFAKKEGLL